MPLLPVGGLGRDTPRQGWLTDLLANFGGDATPSFGASGMTGQFLGPMGILTSVHQFLKGGTEQLQTSEACLKVINGIYGNGVVHHGHHHQ